MRSLNTIQIRYLEARALRGTVQLFEFRQKLSRALESHCSGGLKRRTFLPVLVLEVLVA